MQSHKGSWPAVLWSAGYFFFLLTSYYLLRPVREAMGIERGADKLPWLMTGTMAAMFFVNPAFAALVSRFPRRRFIPITYRCFALNLIGFYVLFRLVPKQQIVWLGYAFYVWLSVFNLFVVSVFWGFMADMFGHERGQRIFGYMAVGGTLGAISGAWITGTLADGISLPGGYHVRVEPGTLMLIAVVPLELAVQCMRQTARHFGLVPPGASGRDGSSVGTGEPGPDPLAGLALIVRSPLLLLICLYMLCYAVTSTFLYIEQGHIVGQTFADKAARTAAFARIDFWVNVLTLTTQLLLTGSIISTLGIRGTLTILPILTIIGFVALAASPVFGVMLAVQVARRGLHYAVDRPARELLFAVLGADEKYKSKPFIDTFVFRGGDLIGGWAPLLLKHVAIATSFVTIPVSMVWAATGLLIGVLHAPLIRKRGIAAHT